MSINSCRFVMFISWVDSNQSRPMNIFSQYSWRFLSSPDVFKSRVCLELPVLKFMSSTELEVTSVIPNFFGYITPSFFFFISLLLSSPCHSFLSPFFFPLCPQVHLFILPSIYLVSYFLVHRVFCFELKSGWLIHLL